MRPSLSGVAADIQIRLRQLSVPRLDSIRNKILAFALLATLIPSIVTLGFAYMQSRRALEDKITQELLSESAQTARELGVALKERFYDLRVFAGSEEVLNSLTGTARRAAASPTRGRLREYLSSLQERFTDYNRLVVVDLDGRTIAASGAESRPVQFPDGWTDTLRMQNQLVGDVQWNEERTRGNVLVAVPVQSTDGRIVGAFAAELRVAPIREQLGVLGGERAGNIHLLGKDGALIASSGDTTAPMQKTGPGEATLRRLQSQENSAIAYANTNGRQVIGTYKPVPLAGWAVVSEIPEDDAFAQVRGFRNAALLVVAILLILALISAYRFGALIVRPLDRLTLGAAEVAAGDLKVDLPEAGGGEVGVLTGVFNEMVDRLREGRAELDAINETLRAKNEELEKLSITDGLTGLANHRFLMQRLNEEAIRSARSERPFSVLMADVDHFKEYNDSFGHPAGDEVLKRVASLLRECTRTVDCVGRYGGEEFAVIMPDTDNDGAMVVAERIRARVAEEEFPGRGITVSVGVAEFPSDADSAAGTVDIADQALYQAKRAGRDRVEKAGDLAKPKADPQTRTRRPSGKAARKKG